MNCNQTVIEHVTALVVAALQDIEYREKSIPISISARHIHLPKEMIAQLFGENYQLHPLKDLSQPNQFAAKETVELIGPKGSIQKVRILGPERSNPQVEISLSDARKLGIEAPVRSSGNLNGTPGIRLRTPMAEIVLNQGVIIADRHIHMTARDAKRFLVQDGEKVDVVVGGVKGGVLGGVTIRVSEDYCLDCHLDTDDANAFQIQPLQRALIKKLLP
ncbi:MAG: Propanediol utilization protein [Caproiciproducens sp.]|jgi:putative phosphotransacetylase|nr:Propanediol utilization protein [Caproiciproducens sp.]